MLSTFILISTGENYAQVVSRSLFCYSLVEDGTHDVPTRAVITLGFFVFLSLIGLVLMVGMFIGVFQDGFARQRKEEIRKTKLFERVGAIAAFSLLDDKNEAQVTLKEFKEFVLSLERDLEMSSVLTAEKLLNLLRDEEGPQGGQASRSPAGPPIRTCPALHGGRTTSTHPPPTLRAPTWRRSSADDLRSPASASPPRQVDDSNSVLELTDFVYNLYYLQLTGVTFQRKEEALGLRWKEYAGAYKPTNGSEIFNEALAAALQTKMMKLSPLVFRQEELDAFRLEGLRADSFIRAGHAYCQPAANLGPWRQKLRDAYDHPSQFVQKLVKFMLIVHTLLACLYGLLADENVNNLDNALASLLVFEAIEVILKLIAYGPRRFWSCGQYNASRVFEQWENRTALVISGAVLLVWLLMRQTEESEALGFQAERDFHRVLLVIPTLRLFFVLKTARRIIFVLVPLRMYLSSVLVLMLMFNFMAATVRSLLAPRTTPCFAFADAAPPPCIPPPTLGLLMHQITSLTLRRPMHQLR